MGGGGRGTRVVYDESELEDAFTRCQSEAQAAFGDNQIYVEEFLRRAKHIEIQIIGDLMGDITHLGDRECSVQRAQSENCGSRARTGSLGQFEG